MGPVPGDFQCVSVAASINRSTTASSWWWASLEERGGEGGGAGSKPEGVAPSCGQTVFLSLSAMLSGGLLISGESNPISEFRGSRERSGLDRRPRWCKCGCTDTKCGDLSVAFFLSLVCYAQFRSVVVSLQSPFQHTTDPEMTTLRISQWLVEGRRTKLKDQANMHKVFRHCFAKSHQGQLFSWRRVQEETVFLFFFFFLFNTSSFEKRK